MIPASSTSASGATRWGMLTIISLGFLALICPAFLGQ